MANYLGIMSVKLSADYATLQSDLGKAAMLNARYAEDMAKKFNDAASQVGKAMGIALAASATALVALTKSTLDANDQLSKLSQKVGVTTENLSALKYQAGLADVEIDALEKGLVKFNKTIGDAAGGSKLQSETFKALGINLRDQNGALKDTDDLLLEVSDKFQTFRDSAAKTALAVNLFGRSGADLIPMLNEGADGFREAYEEADEFGRIVSTDVGRASEQFNDNMTRLKESAAGFGNQLTEALLPSLVSFSDELTRSSKQGDAFKATADAIAQAIKYLAQVLVVAKGVIEAFTNLFAAAFDTLHGVAEVGAGLFTNLGYAVLGLSRAIGGDLVGAAQDFDTAGRTLGDSWEVGTGRIKKAWSTATDGIQQAIDESQRLYDAIDKPQEKMAERAEQFKNVISGVGPIINQTEAPIVAMSAGIKEASKVVDDYIAKLEKQAATYGMAGTELARYELSIMDLSDAQRAQAEDLLDVIDALEETANEAERVADAMGALAEINSSLSVEYDTMIGKMSGLSDAQIAFNATMEDAAREYKKAGGALNKNAVEAYTAAVKKAKDVLDTAITFEAFNSLSKFVEQSPILTMTDQIETLQNALAKISDPMSKAFNPELVDAFTRRINAANAALDIEMVGSFKALLGAAQSFTKEGSSGFKAMEKGMAALSIVQDLLALKAAVTAVLTQGQGDPYSAFARMAAMAAAVAPFIASIGLTLSSLGGGSFSDTAGKRQATQGTGTILGDAEAKSESIANAIEITADATSQLVGINRGMLRALQALEASLGSASGMLARGAGDADFSGLDLSTEGDLSIWEQNDLIGRLLGGSSEVTDQGIIIFGGALNDLLNDIAVGAYQEVQSQSSFFGSTHTNEGIVDVSDEFGRQFQLVIGSIVDTVRAGADALGLLPADIEAAIAAFQVEEIRISLMDLSAEEQQAELAAVFSQLFDGLAGAVVPFIEQFQQVGEGLGETLIRVATGVQVTQEAMRQLGLAIDETDPERFAQISEGLMHAVGGIEEFVDGMNTFVSAFADEGHRLRIATEAINSAFEQAGLTVPATTEGMWELMQSLDATTAEGQEQIATLLRLADTANAYYDLIEKAETSRLEYIMKASDIQTELGIGGGFAGMRAEIESWTTSTIQTLNSLARAAGRAGASEQDLVNVHRLAAQRIAQLIEQLKGELRDLAVTLGYTSAGDTLESLNSQIASMGSASGDAANAIGSAVDSMREKMALLLGDLSPFNDQKKLELALEGLRAGTVDPETVLEIGRRLYASTSNYTNLFNQVMGMAQFGQNGGTNTSTEQGRTLAELIAARDALLAATRPQLAEELASRIAELANATGDEFAAIAQEQGFNLAQLGADLGLNSDELNAYLEQLQAQFESQDFGAVGQMIQDAINNSADRIVEAITGKPIESVIEASDQHMQELAERQKTDREESDARVIAAIDGLTSAVVASGAANAESIVEVLELTRRDLREERNAGASVTERGRIPVQPR